jgi:hypothetical protein
MAVALACITSLDQASVSTTGLLQSGVQGHTMG